MVGSAPRITKDNTVIRVLAVIIQVVIRVSMATTTTGNRTTKVINTAGTVLTRAVSKTVEGITDMTTDKTLNKSTEMAMTRDTIMVAIITIKVARKVKAIAATQGSRAIGAITETGTTTAIAKKAASEVKVIATTKTSKVPGGIKAEITVAEEIIRINKIVSIPFPTSSKTPPCGMDTISLTISIRK